MSDVLFDPQPPTTTRHTERSMLDALHRRYSANAGNGPRYVLAEHVRSAAGFDASRVADMLVMDLWPSSGHAIHGHEVKVSRSDWLRELADPTKAAAFMPYCTLWWLVVPDAAIVRRDELPPGWGVLAPDRFGRLGILHRAPKREPQPMPTTMLAAFARAIAKTARRDTPNETKENHRG
jgi:hypothetical protein